VLLGELPGLRRLPLLQRLDLKLVILPQNVGLLDDDSFVLMGEDTEEMSEVDDFDFVDGTSCVMVLVERPFRRMRTAWQERCFP